MKLSEMFLSELEARKGDFSWIFDEVAHSGIDGIVPTIYTVDEGHFIVFWDGSMVVEDSESEFGFREIEKLPFNPAERGCR